MVWLILQLRIYCFTFMHLAGLCYRDINMYHGVVSSAAYSRTIRGGHMNMLADYINMP